MKKFTLFKDGNSFFEPMCVSLDVTCENIKSNCVCCIFDAFEMHSNRAKRCKLFFINMMEGRIAMTGSLRFLLRQSSLTYLDLISHSKKSDALILRTTLM